ASLPPATAIGEALDVDGGRHTHCEQQPHHGLGQRLGSSGTEDRPRLLVDATVTLEELAQHYRHAAPIPAIDEGRQPFFERAQPLQPALVEEEGHRSRGRATLTTNRPDR